MLRRLTVIGPVVDMSLMEVTDSGVVMGVFSLSTAIATLITVATATMRVAWRCVELDFYIDRITKIDEAIKKVPIKLRHKTENIQKN